jgi:DNA polymerase (family X)
MNIDNDYIADKFSLLSKIMDIHGENSFKTKSYSVAAFTLEKLPHQLTDLPPEKITSIKGIGDAIGKKIQEIIQSGELKLLQEYIFKTPPGIIEMLRIKGLGPKKIATIWKEMEIESIGELLYACQENRLLLYKGFGEKTQQSVRDTIEFYMKSQGSHLFAEVEVYATNMQTLLQEKFPAEKLAFTGGFRRQLEIIDTVQWVTTIASAEVHSFFESIGFKPQKVEPQKIEPQKVEPQISAPQEQTARYKSPEGITLEFIYTSPETFAGSLFQTSCSGEFLEAWQQKFGTTPGGDAAPAGGATPHPSEEAIFSAAGIPFIPPNRREQKKILDANPPLTALIQTGDIRAIIHSHSKWSDGSDTLEEMAAACIQKGYEYLVISDHSKSAFYANGLKEDRIREQHAQIDELNAKLAPFFIFKSIECDILNDGALDYSDDILSTFDLVIASVHSNLKMSEEKAMMRLLGAVRNPFTTILGHMTGRLLLSRPGYPVDHKALIQACAENHVVIELNAHPRRLDVDWRWIDYALDQGVLISIDPDAHSIEGYDLVKYGVLTAQKGGLTPEKNLSSFSLSQFRDYLAARKTARGI